jgi:hypothetical protein
MEATHILRRVKLMMVALCRMGFVLVMMRVSLRMSREGVYTTEIFVLTLVDMYGLRIDRSIYLSR